MQISIVYILHSSKLWLHKNIVSPILALEAQEQAGAKYLLVVTCKAYGSAGLGGTEFSQEIHQAESRYPETFHIYVHLYLTEVILTLDRV